MKDKIRYSMTFKMKVMEELRDRKWKTISEAATAYGISNNTIYLWMRALGFEHLKGRIIYVKTRTELDEIRRLKEELKRLKLQLSDEILEHRIDEAALQIACDKLGTTPEELKKKERRKIAHIVCSKIKRIISAVCRKLGMTRQWFYSSEQARVRKEINEDLVVALVRQERKVNPRAGAKKVLIAIRPELKKAGINIGINRFGNVLKKYNLLIKKRKSYRCCTTRQDPSLIPSPNLVKDLTIDSPNRLCAQT